MPRPKQPRTTALDRDIAAARRRALNERPFTPEWNAAVAAVEQLERARWRRELLATGGYVPPRRRLLSWFARTGRSAVEGAR